MKVFWLAEGLPDRPATYAPANYRMGLYTETKDPWEAKKFINKSECDIWCYDHPNPVYTAVEHGFTEEGE